MANPSPNAAASGSGASGAENFARSPRLDPGIPPVPAHTLDLIKMVPAKHIKLILMEVFYDKRVPELVAAKSGAKLVTVPNSVGGTDAVKTYFDLFDTIVGAMASAAGS